MTNKRFKLLKAQWFNGKFTQTLSNLCLILHETDKAYKLREFSLKQEEFLFNTQNFSKKSYWVPKSKITSEKNISKQDIEKFKMLTNSVIEITMGEGIKQELREEIECKELFKFEGKDFSQDKTYL